MIKTVTLSGKEMKVDNLDGFNTVVHNLSSGEIYASKYPDITPGADNVAEIPAGAAKLISTTRGVVYLLGNGKAELTGQDYEMVNCSSSTTVYSGGASDVTRNYVDSQDALNLDAANSYTDKQLENVNSSVTELASTKADKTEISNPNLLDNWYFPDPINQRGVNGTISETDYFIDCWKLTAGSVEILSGGLLLNGTIIQKLETAPYQSVSASYLTSAGVQPAKYDSAAKTFSISGNGLLVIAAKLEFGNRQTLAREENGKWVLNDPPPNKVLELAKCQRYYWKSEMLFNGWNTDSIFDSQLVGNVQFPVPMRVKPTVTIVSSKGTPDCISNFASQLDADLGEQGATVNAVGLSNEGFSIIRCDWNTAPTSMFPFSFRVIADADL